MQCTDARPMRACSLAIALAMSAQSTAAQSTYRVVDVGTLLTSGSHFSYAFDVNSSGQVAGFSYVLTGYRAFLYDPETGFLLNLGDLVGGNDFSLARAVNDAGSVVGHSSAMIMIQATPTTLERAFLWSSGSPMLDLGAEVLPDDSSTAYDVNSAGQVVGGYFPHDISGVVRGAFLWTPGGGTQFLPHLYSSGLLNTNGNGVNDTAEVVGRSGSQSDPETAYRWNQVDGIEALAGDPGLTSSAWDVNSFGAITGDTVVADGQGGYTQVAYVWTEAGGMTVIDLLPGMVIGMGLAINDSGVVVGMNQAVLPTLCIDPGPIPATVCYSDTPSDRAFIWTPGGGTAQLDALIDPSDPMYQNLDLTSAQGISRHGAIAANGYIHGMSGQHAFLLVPVIIFSDDFESGSTTAWSSSVP